MLSVTGGMASAGVLRGLSRSLVVVNRCSPLQRGWVAGGRRKTADLFWPRLATQGRFVFTTSSRLSTQLQVSPEANGKKLTVVWPDGNSSGYHVLWLRHNCQCKECVVPTSEQQITLPCDLYGDITITSATVTPNGSLSVPISREYNGSVFQHSAEFDLKWLQDHSYTPAARSKHRDDSAPKFAAELPKMSGKAVLEDDRALWDWLKCVNEYGVCLLSDIPTELRMVQKVAERVSYIEENLYGTYMFQPIPGLISYQMMVLLVYDVILEDKPLNMAYTPVALPLHQDNLYYESPPGLQLMHCLRNEVEGGENVILDLQAVCEDLRERHPQFFETLTRVPVTWQRIHKRTDIAVKIQKPHIRVDSDGRIIGMNWGPTVEGPLCVPEEDVKTYYDAYLCLAKMIDESPRQLKHKLQPGEALTFNNRRFAHNRTAFKTGGARHFQGVYVNIDMFKSKLRVLAARFDPDYCVKHVYNNCNN